MLQIKHLSILLAAILFFGTISCKKNRAVQSPESEIQLLEEGDKITATAQALLLSNVAKAMNEKGIAGAVDYCNVQAIPLTDSISAQFGTKITRLSNKNRNPDNALKTREDQQAWERMALLLANNEEPKKHFITYTGKKSANYYKAIPLGMETCLKCHGKIGTDIAPEVAIILQTKYPKDLATGYVKGEFRGMWKVKIDL